MWNNHERIRIHAQAWFSRPILLLVMLLAVWCRCEPAGILGAQIKLYLWSGTEMTGEVKAWAEDSISVADKNTETRISRVEIKKYEIIHSRPMVTAGSPNVSTEVEAWRQKLKDKRGIRTNLLVVGTLGTVAGTGLLIAGFVTNQSSYDVAGCSDAGFHQVNCDTQEGVSKAQAKIDNGLVLMLIGALAMLGGSIALIGGQNRGKEITELEKQGKANGFSFSLDPASGRTAVVFKHSISI